MEKTNPAPEAQMPERGGGGPNSLLLGRKFLFATTVLVLCFAVPLWQLVNFVATSDFRSYILLIPFISLYLIWIKRQELVAAGPPSRLAAGIFLTMGLALVGVYWTILRRRLNPIEDNYLALMIPAFLLCFWGVCCLCWSKETVKTVAFPLGLLVFMVPIPAVAMPPIDAFLQNGSAVFAQFFFALSGTPFLRDGLVFQLPDIRLEIAPECSGIQSSMVLVIIGLVAGYLFLRSPWWRALLALLMIPLGLLRNGFRVFVIGQLCVQISPDMINSPIHRRGGPLFFALSLIPFFLFLYFLVKFERRKPRTKV